MVSGIEINTGLDGFVLLDRISEAKDEKITGEKRYYNDPVYLGIESLAQLGASHVRLITGLQSHVFLLKINQCTIPARHNLYGVYLLNGLLVSHSKSAYSYILKAVKDNNIWIEGEFLYATVEYGIKFNKKLLQEHYYKVLSCLQRESKTGC